ncbi:hypothetical protein PHYBLDRAFT_173352 [Phycomyces blakesleeanus NRRL 1555(-)]|uniref:C2H2-type zinc finger transcription factor n=1 Tax=Phycomyces blakesleeanus (strain ATCC 8743b / DSM 1359 / FGSC 10004 / NBRC 33097 / NRRL 1555) TaxID=763407 RepID=A0A162ND52_PHYB8|nr:hypothetical protein PHYBLDRAFT_173352 [Phycomyces blakesleeanus NRRL 1555(-)]OAD68354.1 hypothetical protein PHYBLDRAFT_173352 [Phycomyces blakesleeanus NRRL 1555(-)]|eukprot:XP_018286394.1 hypothetical protein PHYBLDRAFT_173352 [Phycomyces blakesleeanus NRRL 1555(-)]
MAETLVVPMDYVVLKSKIGKGFPYMKADERKSWVLVYSPILLKAVLPIEMFRNWISFVDACRQLVKPSITFSDIDDGHKFLQEFCTKCQRIYTPTILTCNMHLHLHLCETIRDFGPVYGYWLFGFERYNGLLKNVNTNRKDFFEVTYMNSFVQDTFKVAYCMPNLEGYQHLCSPFSFVNNQIIKLKSINLLVQVYKGCKYASGRGSFVQSLFLGSQGNNRLAYTDQIQYLFLHSFTPPFQIEHYHSRELESVDICSADFIACDFECILPVHRISSVVATCDYKTSTNNKKILVNALPHKQYN